MRARGPFFALLLGGCLTEESYPEKVADDLCNRLQLCFPVQLTEQYHSLGECEDAIERSMNTILASSEALQAEWDRDRAQTCLDAIAAPTCDSFDVGMLLDLCAQAWGTPD